MLADLLSAIRVLVDEARAPRTLEWGDPRKVLVLPNGLSEPEEHQVPPPLRNHSILGLSDFCAHVLDEKVCPDPEVYFCGEHAVVYHDREDRREASTMPLLKSERWMALERVRAEPVSGGPAVIAEWCRKNLAGTGIEAVLAALERIDFVRAQASHAGAGRGQESLGHSVEAKVQGIDRIPDHFTLKLCPWVNPGAEGAISVEAKVGLFIAAGEQRIELFVLPDALTTAGRVAIGQLREFLAKSLGELPVFCGDPRPIG